MSEPGTHREPEEESEDSNKEVDSFVSNLLEEVDPGAMMTKYVIIIEGIDADGDRAIYTYTHDDATVWDVLGMVDYVHMREQTHMIKRMKEGDDDE